MPILCVDVVVAEGNKFLLVKRTKEPLKDRWWVPGGRILKGETVVAATKRKVKEELGINMIFLKALGYYEKHFRKNEFGLEEGIHTLSIVVMVKPLSSKIELDNQSSAWRWSDKLPKDFKIKPFCFGGNV